MNLTYTFSSPICPGVDDGSISLNISDGVPPFNTLWDKIVNDEEISSRSREKSDYSNKVLHEKTLEEIAIFPLAIPLIAGPAALTSVLLLVNASSKYPEKLFMVYFGLFFSGIIGQYVIGSLASISLALFKTYSMQQTQQFHPM